MRQAQKATRSHLSNFETQSNKSKSSKPKWNNPTENGSQSQKKMSRSPSKNKKSPKRTDFVEISGKFDLPKKPIGSSKPPQTPKKLQTQKSNNPPFAPHHPKNTNDPIDEEDKQQSLLKSIRNDVDNLTNKMSKMSSLQTSFASKS